MSSFGEKLEWLWDLTEIERKDYSVADPGGAKGAMPPPPQPCTNKS